MFGVQAENNIGNGKSQEKIIKQSKNIKKIGTKAIFQI